MQISEEFHGQVNSAIRYLRHYSSPLLEETVKECYADTKEYARSIEQVKCGEEGCGCNSAIIQVLFKFIEHGAGVSSRLAAALRREVAKEFHIFRGSRSPSPRSRSPSRGPPTDSGRDD